MRRARRGEEHHREVGARQQRHVLSFPGVAKTRAALIKQKRARRELSFEVSHDLGEHKSMLRQTIREEQPRSFHERADVLETEHVIFAVGLRAVV